MGIINVHERHPFAQILHRVERWVGEHRSIKEKIDIRCNARDLRGR